MVLARAATKTGPSCSEFLRAGFPAGGAVGAGLGSHVRSPARRISTETARLLAREATETSLSCQGPPAKRPTIWDNPLPLSQPRSPQNSHYPMSGPEQPLKPTSPFSFWQTIPPVSFAHKKHIIFILRFRSRILSSYYSHIAVLFCDDCQKEAASEPDKMESLLVEILVCGRPNGWS